MKNHKYAMKKKMENVRSDQRHWGRGRQRPAQDVVRSFSAPHPAKVATMGRHRGLPARSLSANEAPSKDRTLDERYDLPYCDVTSPSEDEPEEVRRENLGPPKAEVPVGPPRRVIASLVPGSGLQRPQFRGPVRSYNPRVRDLARDTQTPQCWAEEDFMDGGVDSADLADVDEVGMSLQAAERQMMGTPGSTALQLGALTSPAAVMLAIQESDDDDETVIDFSQDIGSGKLSSGSEMPPTLMENMYKKNNSLSSRQNLSQLSNQTTLSQTQVTSSTTQMSASSSSRVASSRMQLSSSETKANSVKSDLSNFKNSISEMKTLSNFKRLRNSMENLVDATDPSCDPPPIVTFPDSETPPPNDLSMTMPTLNNANNKSAHMLSSMNSSKKHYGSMDTLKYESRTSSASKTQVKTDFSSSSSEEQRRRAGDHSCLGLGSGTRSQHTATAVETRAAERNAYKEQRTLVAGEVTQQESGNMTSSLKVQTDSYSSEQKASSQQQARSNYTSSTGLFSQSEKHVAQSNMSYSKGICTVVSSQKSQLMNGTIKTLEDDLSTMTFEDLDRLGADSNPKEVEKAIDKYSSQLDAFVKKLKTSQANEQSIKKTSADLDRINEILRRAWSVPTFGHELGHSLCNALRASGGLDLLMTNCDENNGDLQFSSAQLLEQCLTTENRAHVAENGLEKVVKVACVCTKRVNSVDHARVGTGILEHLFKHSEGTCSDVIKLGGLDAVLFECRKNDIETLRHCAGALANLSLYGGAENQEAMIKRQVPTWLFPLANHPDDNIKYYACLAIAVLVANSEIEAAVLQSGTLDLVEPFVTSHNPSEFARSNHAHAHGQSKSWLEKLVPVLSSKREEARNLAAFHFCMEAGIKQQQGNTSVFREIGAIEPLKNVASCPNAVASRYAAQALKLMGEELPHKLSQQVPLWSTDDVREWVKQIGFGEYALNFVESRVDGDLLLQLNESNLTEDIGLTNGIRRRRFTRELQNLKKIADYTSRDTANLNTFLQNIDPEYCIYTYSMLNAGVDKDSIKGLSDEQLELECGITNSIHRLRILDAIKSPESALYSMNERYTRNKTDAFVSYRRSNGSQLASLLKVHLSLRGFSVFIDVERLEAGKFDNNLLQSIRHAKNFLLVLTPKALDRCIRDGECKDWVHKEIVAALNSNCNIIPIIDDFTWPDAEELPEDMRQICHFNGVRWIHDYQDACVDRLERFMRGERGLNINNSAPPTPAYLGRGPPTYQRMPSSDSSKGSDKDQTNGSRD